MDRRLTPSNGRVAARHLEGKVRADHFVDPVPREATGNPFLLASPGGARDRQLLTGDAFDVYEVRDGWAYGRAAKDGYCGWLPETALADPGRPTHRISARTTWLCPVAGVRQPPLADLHFGARVEVLGEEGRWSRVRTGGVEGFLPSGHLAPADQAERHPVAVLRLFLGTPYLWAGNTGFGIDCSGLVQAALLACGHPCPGDSDLQEAAVGRPLDPREPPRAGDLLFWPGHVAMLADAETLIHANGHSMDTRAEPLDAALARIAAEGVALRCRRRFLPE